MNIECSICLQICVHPARLECNHVFCFLCVKGAAAQNRRCPMCRQPIPDVYFDSPHLIEDIKDDEIPLYEDGYQWFYEGRNGWWLYDKRASDDIEDAHSKKLPKCELLIAGYLYVIDFEKMLQYRRSEPQRQRRVKRDRPDSESTKGIAGLRRQNTAVAACGSTSRVPSESSTSERSTDSTQATVSTQRNLESDLEAEIEQNLAARLENSTLTTDGYRETYL